MVDEALKLVTDASLVESEWMLKTAATEVDRILQYHFVSPRFAAMAVQQVMDTINTVCRSRGGHYSGYSCKAQLQFILIKIHFLRKKQWISMTPCREHLGYTPRNLLAVLL
jgi:hypothetical protein